MKFNFSLNGFLKSLVTPYPARDWFLALCLFIAVFIGLGLYAGYLFVGIHEGTIVGSGNGAPAALPNVSKTDLSTEVSVYNSRKAAYDSRSFPRPIISNPIK